MNRRDFNQFAFHIVLGDYLVLSEKFYTYFVEFRSFRVILQLLFA